MKVYRVRRHKVTQPADPTIRLIPLTKGQNATVSTEDYERLVQFNWCALWATHTKSFYAARVRRVGSKQQTIYMAREILGCAPGEQIDHASGDTLDNRRQNLRVATQAENMRNRRMRHDNSSGFKGVYRSRGGKFQAQIGVDGVRKHLGYFADPVDAARAYNHAASQLHGTYACLNEVPEVRSELPLFQSVAAD